MALVTQYFYDKNWLSELEMLWCRTYVGFMLVCIGFLFRLSPVSAYNVGSEGYSDAAGGACVQKAFSESNKNVETKRKKTKKKTKTKTKEEEQKTKEEKAKEKREKKKEDAEEKEEKNDEEKEKKLPKTSKEEIKENDATT